MKHEYHRKPTLVGAGTFGLDDVFARIKPFVSRNLRPLFSPLPRPTENCGDGGGPTESCTPTGFPAGGSAGRSPSPGAVRLAPVAAAGEGGTFSRNRSQGAGKCGGEGRRQRSELPAAGLSRPGGCGTVQQERLGGQEAARPGGRPLLYFASVDIKHCYDTVDQVGCLFSHIVATNHIPSNVLQMFSTRYFRFGYMSRTPGPASVYRLGRYPRNSIVFFCFFSFFSFVLRKNQNPLE